ncbi:metallopeptidase [Nocardia huaxiensis]|uniref:Metallopeptidase n=1 Tax=Nocardia huaxiensis TaxID=2755382 RepID=A0A7D6VED0_9NOCA|nr:metallopeptidase [Nocardia huaxiensis]QLY33454.1 metallopeptidase [Nocardia huaxiensis]UFS99635.1 metallopeptidase [Nocardia huaxiensis]
MRNSRLWAGVAAVVLVAGVALTGCGVVKGPGSQTVSNRVDDPFEIEGMASATGPNGPREGVPDAELPVQGGDGGAMDQLVVNALADLQEFWTGEYPRNFPGSFTPPSLFVSWDATAPRSQAVEFCRETTFELVNAAYCGLDESIGWDRGVLLPELQQKFGAIAVVMVMAHEYGHALQTQARLNGALTPNVVVEQQADCFEGVFLRHVAEGDSRHFTVNTTDGLNSVLGATIAVRDKVAGESADEHGTAFERVTAVQIGYEDGAQACAEITRAELEERRGTLPTSYRLGLDDRQLTVNRQTLDQVAGTLTATYPVRKTPTFDYSGVTRGCPDVTTTQPVSYCPADNTVGTDVQSLARLARGGDEDELLSSMVAGDYSGFVLFVSRYMLAVQEDRQLSLTGAETAGLRAACLAGAYSTKLSVGVNEISLSSDDLDEAVSGLLADGLAAADVNGEVVASGFVRLEAFRTGVLDGDSACYSTYR